jgi:hypothetical protein
MLAMGSCGFGRLTPNLSEGVLQSTEGVSVRGALSLHGNLGGLLEVTLPDPVQHFQDLNPHF